MVTGAKTQWDEKYLREHPFMPFGSMMNAFGRINQGKEMPLAAFIVAADALFKKSQDYVLEQFNSVHRDDEVDLPRKKS